MNSILAALGGGTVFGLGLVGDEMDELIVAALAESIETAAGGETLESDPPLPPPSTGTSQPIGICFTI